jgi:uncharacterized protein (TIGR02246 family)
MSNTTIQGQDITAATEAIAKIIQNHERAWNNHDRQAFESIFTDDADFVNVIGRRAIGREQIGADFENIHKTFMRDTHLKILTWDARFVAPGVAVVRLRWQMSGMAKIPGWNVPDVRNGLLTYVAVERNREWKVTAVQNTDEQNISLPK